MEEMVYVAGAEILYSEDLSDGQYYGGVKVENPFSLSESTPTG
jgi:predicted nucleic acid-binding protein